MRNPDQWPAAGPVSDPGADVTISGIRRDVESVSVTRSIPQALAQQVTGAGGINAASASVTVVSGGVVTEESDTPWTALVPRPGQSAMIDAGLGDERVRAFTGVVDNSSGAFAASGASVSFVDRIDQLNRQVKFPALNTTMPPRIDGVFEWRQIGLCSTYFTDRTLRQCGFYATPPMEDGCVISAPMMGSTNPERGIVEVSRKRTGTHWEGLNFGTMPTGVGLWDVYAEWSPSTYANSLRWTPFQITICRGDMPAASAAQAGIRWANGNRVYMNIASNGQINLRTIISGSNVSHLAANPTGWRKATVRVNPNDGSFRLRFDTGEVYGGAIPNVPTSWAEANWRGYVDSTDRYLNGFQVSFPTPEFQAVTHAPNAILTPPANAAGPEIPELYASPAIPPTPAIDLLKQQAEAELAAMWLDEDGVFRWANRVRLREQSVSGVYTSSTSLMNVSWSLNSEDTSRRVSVKYREPATRRSFRHSIVAWQGNSAELTTGEYHEEFIEPDQDTDWIDVDTQLSTFMAGTHAEFNRGRGTWHGWQNLDADGNWTPTTGVDATPNLRLVTEGTWAYSLRVNALPTGIDRIRLSTREEDNLLAPPYRGQGLPLLRCRSLIQWADVTADSTQIGPSWAADLEHDVAWWVQSTEEARALADEIGSALAWPEPLIESAEIVGDARLQLGDKIRLEDPDVTGIHITGVVCELNNQISAADHSMTVKLIVTDVGTPTTLGDFDARWESSTLSNLDWYWSDRTLAELDAEPLR